jgi:hypothetical protein
MKLRLLGNKIRFRLSEPEVFALAENSSVQSSLPINPFENDNFRYSIKPNQEIESISIRFEHNELRIELPIALVKTWAKTDKVGIDHSLLTNSGEEISILIEKDFQCLTERGEDETNLFKNPNSGGSH